MRLNDIDICNEAIGLCGSTEWIQTLGTAGNTASLRCDRFFESAVQRVLRKHNWSCATNFVQLAQNTTEPVAEFDYAYTLPFDLVRVINAYGDSEGYSPYNRWRIVGRDLHTNLDTIYLKYVQMPEDYRELDVLLASAISYELAVLLAPTLVKDKEQFYILKREAMNVLAQAKAIDTLENKDLYVENDVYQDHRDIVGSHTASRSNI